MRGIWGTKISRMNELCKTNNPKRKEKIEFRGEKDYVVWREGLAKEKMEVSMDRADWDPTLNPCMVAKRVKR